MFPLCSQYPPVATGGFTKSKLFPQLGPGLRQEHGVQLREATGDNWRQMWHCALSTDKGW